GRVGGSAGHADSTGRNRCISRGCVLSYRRVIGSKRGSVKRSLWFGLAVVAIIIAAVILGFGIETQKSPDGASNPPSTATTADAPTAPTESSAATAAPAASSSASAGSTSTSTSATTTGPMVTGQPAPAEATTANSGSAAGTAPATGGSSTSNQPASPSQP